MDDQTTTDKEVTMRMRRQDRVDCNIILNKYERGSLNIVHATNISLGGMRFKRLLEPYLDRSDSFRLELAIPGSEEPIMIGAKRVYENDDTDTVGVRFTDMSHNHFLRLREWIQNQMLTAELPALP